MTKKLFALVDCNNFFASCEQVFRPDLEDKPVAVLSNNDGCVIARSRKVKELGIPMGAPAFKYRDIFLRNDVHIFSANFPLYGDFSERIVNILKKHVAKVEVYSIDESFLDLTDLKMNEIEEYLRELRLKIRKQTGIWVSIGIGSTKTLSKLANHIAKQSGEYGGVFFIPDYMDDSQNSGIFQKIDIGEVWGLGRRRCLRLNRYGVQKVADFLELPKRWVKQELTVQGERTYLELRGIPCYEFAPKPDQRKTLACTRSFGEVITEKSELLEALTIYTDRASEKLRADGLEAKMLSAFIRTGKHNVRHYYKGSKSIDLLMPTNYFPDLLKAVEKILDQVYKPGIRYKKAGVILSDLRSESSTQFSLDTDESKLKSLEKQRKLMRGYDLINSKWGRSTLKLGSQKNSKNWKMKQEQKSPAYTTRWEDLPVIKVD